MILSPALPQTSIQSVSLHKKGEMIDWQKQQTHT